jgi:hypothetical protein
MALATTYLLSVLTKAMLTARFIAWQGQNCSLDIRFGLVDRFLLSWKRLPTGRPLIHDDDRKTRYFS